MHNMDGVRVMSFSHRFATNTAIAAKEKGHMFTLKAMMPEKSLKRLEG